MERTVRLYRWYALTFNAYFWMPVFVLYFLRHMPLADVLRLESVYYLGVVLLEVPSGYFSDRIGRRPTLLLACGFLIAAYSLFAAGSSFAVFAIAQILLAAGLAFNSGTDTSLHYDALTTLGRDSEYGTREALAARNALLASAVGGLLGGLAGSFDLRLAYVLSAASAVASLIIVIAMREPTSHERTLAPPGPVHQAKLCLGLLSDGSLIWTFAYAVFMTVINHVPYEFYQPYLQLAFAENSALRGGSPALAGVHMGVAMLLASSVAGRSIRLRDRLGYTPVLLIAAALQAVIIVAMGLVLHPIVLVLVLLRSIPRALSAAPLNSFISPRVPKGQRATYLSIQSLAGRLAFAGVLAAISFVGQPGEVDGSWASVSSRLLGCAALAIAGLLLLSATAAWRDPQKE
ncbi:MAG: MFS transporter [Phycisphaerales bacterium]|nr:MFS transporter [Phycisphaerales bacterium]